MTTLVTPCQHAGVDLGLPCSVDLAHGDDAVADHPHVTSPARCSRTVDDRAAPHDEIELPGLFHTDYYFT
jgi:hypothetical protein